uniref:Uncharacterized protein n=1 Tax=Anguilla anguilla TaxID=7936 RepID=A0A0E9R7I3_ANGAN
MVSVTQRRISPVVRKPEAPNVPVWSYSVTAHA